MRNNPPTPIKNLSDHPLQITQCHSFKQSEYKIQHVVAKHAHQSQCHSTNSQVILICNKTSTRLYPQLFPTCCSKFHVINDTSYFSYTGNWHSSQPITQHHGGNLVQLTHAPSICFQKALLTILMLMYCHLPSKHPSGGHNIGTY